MNQGIDAFRWNVPTEDGKPADARDCVVEGLVRNTSYSEISDLLGTSGCSSLEPHWGWEVLGVVVTARGRVVVSPGDWVVTLNGDPIGVYADDEYRQTFAALKMNQQLVSAALQNDIQVKNMLYQAAVDPTTRKARITTASKLIDNFWNLPKGTAVDKE